MSPFRSDWSGHKITVANKEEMEYIITIKCIGPKTACLKVSISPAPSFPILVAPTLEQKEIARRVEALFKVVDAIEGRYQKAKAYVDKLAQSILAKAFRGELVPQDLNDEPAAALLDRIREKKAKRESEKKTNKKKSDKKVRREPVARQLELF